MNKSLLIASIGLIVCGLLCMQSFYYGKQVGKADSVINMQITDTVFVTDYIEVETPAPYEVKVVKTVYLTDTVYVGREMFYILNYQKKKFRGNDYYAEVSGFEVNLDSIAVKVNTAYIDRPIVKEVKVKPFVTWGVQVGFGAQYGLINKKFDTGPYLGIGVQFNF